MIEAKRPEKNRFLSQKWWTGRGTSQPAQPARVPVDRLLLPDWGPVKRCKKYSLSSSSLSFPVKKFIFLVEVRSRVAVTCQSFNAPMTSESIDPQLDWLRLFLVIWLPMLETYKLRAPLHLWVREHLHLFVYLLVLAIKALILFLVH